MAPLSSIDRLRVRVRRLRGRYREISSRARLSYSWIGQFACGARGQRPAFDTLERLGNALDVMEREEERNGRRRESARTTKERRAGKAVGRKPR